MRRLTIRRSRKLRSVRLCLVRVGPWLGILTLLLVLDAGCGGAVSSRPEESRADRLARSLDAAEERMDAERVILDGLDPAACSDRCRSVSAICDASTEICGIARELGDERSRARCARADDACSTSREVVTTGGCACPVPASADVPTS